MAIRQITVIVSDLSGAEIGKDEAWTVELTPSDARRNKVRLDVAESEIQQFLSAGTEVKRRGRRPGSRNKPKES